MAGVIKVNPNPVVTEFEQIGKKITWFNLVFAADPTGSVGPTGAVQAVYNTIQKMGVIIAAGPLSATAQSFGVEGIFTDQDNFDGTVGDGDLARLEADLQALGIVDGVDLSGVTVVAKTLVLA